MRGILLLALFIGIPLIEIALFVQIGGRIGILWTIVIVIATAIAGTYLLRLQGLAVMNQARRTMEAGGVPVESLIDGLFLLIAGILLLTPGFLTDFIGFLFFLPPVRHSLGRRLWALAARSGSVHFHNIHPGGGSSPNQRPGQGRHPDAGAKTKGIIIEGEIVESDLQPEEPANSNAEDDPDSPWRH